MSMSFSERNGYRPPRPLQVESMDDGLKNAIWSVFMLEAINPFLDKAKRGYRAYGSGNPVTVQASPVHVPFVTLWIQVLEEAVDDMPPNLQDACNRVRTELTARDWMFAYEFIESMLKSLSQVARSQGRRNELGDRLARSWGLVLNSKRSGFRIVNDLVVPITDETELAAVAGATSDDSPFAGARMHIRTALERFSERRAPDYRNAIKEAISAVESACQRVTGDPKATLGKALKKLPGGHHQAFTKSLEALYGYTSDADGIRHALTDDAKPITAADAKYMLVACSAFVNYLAEKSAEPST